MRKFKAIDRYRFIADLHLGDKRHAYQRLISTHDHCNNVIDSINSQIDSETILILVGDIICDREFIPHLRRLRCAEIVYIIGNRESNDPRIIKDLMDAGYEIFSSIRVDGSVLVTHIPPHSQEALRYKKVIHGHLHNDVIYNDAYRNVSEPITKGKVLTFKEIMS